MSRTVYFGVGEVARQTGVEPRVISDLLYSRKLSIDRCPIVAGRRLIPSDYVPEIKRVLDSNEKDDVVAETAAKAG